MTGENIVYYIVKAMESQPQRPHPAHEAAWLAMSIASQALSEPIAQSIEDTASPEPFTASPDPFANETLFPRSPSMQQPVRWLTTDDENIENIGTPAGQRLVRLTDDDVLVVLRLCLQEQAAFGHQTDKMFWRLISRRLFESRGKEHKTLHRVVAKAVRERREFLALLPSGEHDNQSSMTDALDIWIAVQDARLEVQKARLDA